MKLKLVFTSVTVFIFVLFFAVQAGAKGQDNTIYIEKLEATSTDLKAYRYRAQNIFQKGEWRSYPMVNGNEGVMLYFLDKAHLKDDQVKLGSYVYTMKVECSSFKKMVLYIDGAYRGRYDCTKEVKLNRTVRSLFIQSQPEKSSKPVAVSIASIQFFDKKGKRQNVVFPRALEGSVKASSVVEPAEAYQPFYVFDSRAGFGWVEGKKDAGIGEGLTIDFKKNVKLTGLEIYTGYQRSKTHFDKNAAPTELEISFDGRRGVKVPVKSMMNSQRVIFPKAIQGKKLSIKIAGVRKGSKWQDTVISEITFLKGNQRYTVYDQAFVDYTKGVLKKVKGSSLEKVVGANLFYATDCEMTTMNETFLLRPNGSFVYWYNFDEDGDVRKKLRDGNWMIKKTSKGKSIIQIFGRYKEIEKRTEYNYDAPYGSAEFYRNIDKNKDYIFSDKNLSFEIVPFEGYQKNSQDGCCNQGKFKNQVKVKGSTIKVDFPL